MNLAEHFQKTTDFLERYKAFWFDEILNLYPATLDAYPKSWIETLAALSPHELWEFDCKINHAFLKNTPIQSFIEEVRSLCSFPLSLKIKSALSKDLLRGMREKKAHEISLLVPYLGELANKYSFSHIVDIGGGVGHLSRILTNNFPIRCICLDHDKTLQNKGKSISNGQNIEFISKGLGNPVIASKEFETLNEEESERVFSKDSLAVGLHSCGPLSLRIMDEVLNHKSMALLNFPCCYLKLDTQNHQPYLDK